MKGSPSGYGQFHTLGQHHQIPKCSACGAVTQWKVESLFLSRHLIIGGLLLLTGIGFLYLPIVGLQRMGKENRAKICPMCGSKNLWTFVY